LNLVKLIGHLEADNERILVTEFVPNGNLRQHLDGDLGVTLDMSKRLDIAIDVAHALAYLHFYADNPIIHRDVKSSNILLSETFRAKVADFGFSRMGPAGDASASCVLTQLKGTAGYLDPEYLKTNMLNVKSDVYSFGILLIELFSGRRPLELNRPSDERITLLWAFRCLTAGNLTAVLDPNIEKTPAVMGILERLFELAFSCSAPTRNDRPNMKKAQAALWNIRKAYQAKIDHQREKLEDEKDENSVARVKTKANVDLASPRTRSSRPSDNIESARATRLNRRNEQEHSAKASSNHGAENQEGVRSRRQSESKNIRQPSEAGCSEGTAATEGLNSNYPAENLDSPADQNLDSPPTATVIH
jgi:serine/threonine protein kinase